ncbi:hypothetical protein COW80_00160 [Candidatus Beckwithbacteria bacterium CG22_combo_CG10-13_8_21_14_all_01_47_9]|uniref:Toxin n=5 Tax=Candidatus Beckwithiibacteriota TaxID=1752726 RepID=A0A2H0E2J7_9BACT|nr:MAG: hypothetical protein AUJ59_01490 [Candidatus Beckwithbacteria bacterium CG1_02_47_37]PIP52044.1 MAG: hypothetical protein COX09_03860 [Candidatus Beckwithbacteria bacterium CG23_combo_of_CG06-09_8_20_14_all_47_9]PIP88471.1 MAG: hypothetical protein COW80_00160 [Candidatus Beckwithbacteria bacterium CG22_combo_CG10-13_8_21_14_all_01_47_9]PJA23306.1 MAG: hypothetical protein COX59_00620 [Candidatus Beckwithbacteria bacterium CG_4_10_14_0_2_um_filter_47_25]PJC66025.1 MAG: hypothetical prot
MTLEFEWDEAKDKILIYLVKFKNYIYVIPYVKNNNKSFLKTIFASRKFTKKLLKEKNDQKH